jgi:hypothetical protein
MFGYFSQFEKPATRHKEATVMCHFGRTEVSSVLLTFCVQVVFFCVLNSVKRIAEFTGNYLEIKENKRL